MRAYAYAREGRLQNFLQFNSYYCSDDKTSRRFMKSDVLFYGKWRVVLWKVTCRFMRSDVSFYEKWRVVLWKVTCCFASGIWTLSRYLLATTSKQRGQTKLPHPWKDMGVSKRAIQQNYFITFCPFWITICPGWGWRTRRPERSKNGALVTGENKVGVTPVGCGNNPVTLVTAKSIKLL